MIFIPPPLSVLAPAALAFALSTPAPEARAQGVATIAIAAAADSDDIQDAYENLIERREEYREDLAERREEYLEDYDDDLRKLHRRRVLRPPFAIPPAYGLPGPYPGPGAFGPVRPYRPYVLSPVPPVGASLGYGYPPYGYGAFPYYGFGPRGGIDIPFGFGLGGLSIRW